MSNPKDPFDELKYGPTYQPQSSGGAGELLNGDFDTHDDLPAEGGADGEGFQGGSLEKLGDYLSARSKVSHYKIEPGSQPAISHRGIENGTPPVPSGWSSGGGGENADGQVTFIDDLLDKSSGQPDGGVEEHHFVRIGEGDYDGKPTSNEGDYVNVEPGTILDKTARGPGHTLYAGVKQVLGSVTYDGGRSFEADAEAHPVQKRTSILLGNNRFHPGKGTPYLDGTQWGDAGEGGRGTMGSQQKTFGVYDSDAAAYDVKQLMKMGRALCFASTGHGVADPDEAGNYTKAILPNFAQLAIPTQKVKDTEIRAKDVAEAIGVTNHNRSNLINDYDGTFGSGRGALADDSRNDTTYGQMNSYAEPFAGPMPLGMITLAAVSILALLAVSLLIHGMILLFTNPLNALPRHPNPDDPTSYPKGSAHQKHIGNFMLDLLGIPRTEFNFAIAIERGLAAFYGFQGLITDFNFANIAELIKTIQLSSGYYSAVMRNAVRDLESAEKAIMEFPSEPGAMISAGLGVIMAFTDAATVRFLMTMASMGDIILVAETYTGAPMGQELDDITETGASRTGKSRSTRGQRTLVWRQSALPSRYILPNTWTDGAIQYGLSVNQAQNAIANSPIGKKFVVRDNTPGAEVGAAAPADVTAAVKMEGPAIQNGRLSLDYVEHIENLFEMEYVPFYFQDLRTNEILGFHAFIESVSDDFSPDYTTVSGYGRIDDVMIYKKTTRSINLTFFIAATNPEDFDSMWFDINKLTTLVYPQWSRGVPMSGTGTPADQYVMPFSQLPTASPLIRLRLGDLVKSNYSRFNLARLFGAGQDDNTFSLAKTAEDVPKSSDIASGQANTALLAALEKAKIGTKIATVENVKSGKQEPTKSPKTVKEAGMIESMKEGMRVWCEPSAKGYKGVDDGGDVNPIAGKDIFRSTRVKFAEDQVVTIEMIAVPSANPLPFPKAEGVPWYHVKFENEAYAAIADPSGTNAGFWVEWQQLRPHEDTLYEVAAIKGEQLRDAADAGDPTKPAEIQKFFGREANPLVRSFESAGGRGLPGFIKSMSFSYDAAPWETRRLGSKAPMWVKVTMGFAPIHDIPPGIDADGFNRGAIFNVGRVMNGIAGDDIHGTNFNYSGEGIVERDAANRAEIFRPAEESETSGGLGGF